MRIHAGTLASLLYADLCANGWNGSSEHFPGETEKHFAMTSLYSSLVKKYLPGTFDTTPEADAAALDKFLSTNESCRAFQYSIAERPDWVRVAMGEAKAFLYNFFYPPHRDASEETPWGLHEEPILTYAEIAKGFDIGPGASIGAKSTDFYSKLALSPLTATSSALHQLYVQAIRHHPRWSGMEVSRSGNSGYAIVRSSRLSFVPKYTEISRTICTEPLLNMVFQKGIASILERRLRQVMKIDLSVQPSLNADLARIGSVTGKFGTIDLSSASDSMSLSLVREMFPADVVRWLEMTRSKTTILPDGREIELHMISSMGNAFTFPLQTIYFSALVYGAYRSMGIPLIRPKAHAPGNFAVFGDDIIVDNRAYDLVVELLSLSGFSVNVDKSFNSGLFRESCGSDFYRGYNVRGVYVKRLRDANDCYSAINRLNRWSARHRVYLCNLVDYLSHKCRFLPIPYDEDDSGGIKVPEALLTRRTLNRHTQAIAYRVSVLEAHRVRVDPLRGRPRLPNWFENPDGLLLALLAGSLRDGFIGLRSNTRKAGTRRRYSSRWDYVPFAQTERSGYREDWKVFTSTNLGKS